MLHAALLPSWVENKPSIKDLIAGIPRIEPGEFPVEFHGGGDWSQSVASEIDMSAWNPSFQEKGDDQIS